jgi:tripartite ATP-independent transporter DctP family solute receptor
MKTKIILFVFFLIMGGFMYYYFDLPLLKKNELPQRQGMVSQSETIQLKFAHDMPKNTPQHLAAVRFADIVEYKTKGRVKIDVFPNQQLGTDQQMIEFARTGKLAIALPPTAKLTTLIPAFQLLDLPFLFPDREKTYEILDGPPGKALLNKLTPFGLIGMTFWESGFKQFTANKPIRKPQDFKGLNIRVMKSKTIMNQFKAFGASPVIIDFHKTYQALSDGFVDGQENPLASIVNMKFHEVQSHMTISNHAYLAYAFVFSKVIFEKLPTDIQQILIDTAKEITSFERKEVINSEKNMIAMVEESGTIIHQLSEQERVLFKKATCTVIDSFDNIDGKQILRQIQHHLAQNQPTEISDDIIIGLNADLVAGSALSGLSIKRGMQIAINEINQNGGLLGKQLRLIVKDNSGLSARGRDNMIYFSRLDNLVAVMCGIYSPIALAVLDIVHQEKIVFLNPWAAATKIVDNGYSPNFVFRVSVRDAFAGPFLIQKALESHNNIALLLVNDGWGKGNEHRMRQVLSNRNMKPVCIQFFNWGEKDMNDQLDNIESSGADVIIMVASSVEGSFIVKNMASRSKKIPIISHWGITGGHFWKEVNRELHSVQLSFLQSFSFFTAQTERSMYLIKQYFQMYDVNHIGKIFAPVGTANAYDLVKLLAIAIETSGTIDRQAVRKAMEEIENYHGVVKYFNPPFTKDRHDALDQSSFMLCQYDQYGYIVPVNNQLTKD